jgi:hypothetical protein
VTISVLTTKNLSHYLELVKALSDKYKVTISVSAVFLHLYDGGLCWVLKGKLEGTVFDIVIGFGATH